MSAIIRKGNSKIVLLNPSEKVKRYTRQLRNGFVSETGKVLSPEDKAFRHGYLTSRSDSAKCYKAKLKKR